MYKNVLRVKNNTSPTRPYPIMDTIGIIVGFGPAALILGSIGWVFMRLTFPEGYTVKGLFTPSIIVTTLRREFINHEKK
jgi:hypothetical protein